MKLPLPETIRSLSAHGWRVICSDREQVHVTSGERHCILVVNGDYNRTPHHMLYVVATRYAPVDVMSGALAALDELTLAKGGTMSEPINDGGPAFPRASGPEPRVNSVTDYCDGMSMRDWFAGQALAGGIDPSATTDRVVREAYEIADAMLAERAKAKP